MVTSQQVCPFLLSLDSPEATLARAGGKGASLARLKAAGLPVPPGFHIATDAYDRFVEANHLVDGILSAASQAQAGDPATPAASAVLDRASEQIQTLIAQGTMPADMEEMIRQRYADLGPDVPVAVRSSATAEDLPDMSFAGQLETYLNIRGGDDVIGAVKRCWASLWTARAIGYRLRQGIPPQEVSIAVVVQQLVAAQSAGVLFTVNPVTGARDELIVNAAWGLGEAIVSGRVTPDTMVIDKKTGVIRSQQIARKEVMTVRHESEGVSGTREEPVPDSMQQQAALQPVQATELGRLAVKIEQLYGQPMDIEWAMCDGQIYILQARPVTALPPPRVVLDWSVPRKGARYFRTSVAEILPEPLSPLFETLALPLWDRATQKVMAESKLLRPGEFSLLTIHGYAFYEMALTTSQTVRMLLNLALHARPLVAMLRKAREQWADGTRPRYANVAAEWAGRDLAAKPTVDLLAGAQQIVEAAASYYVSIQMVLAVANLSEAIFNGVYNHLIKRKNDLAALTFLLGFDSAPIRAEKSLYDLAQWASLNDELAEYLADISGKDFAAAYQAQSAPISGRDIWTEFSVRLAEHLNQFGHAVYNLDFAESVPAEAPALLLETLKYFVSGKGNNPGERQAEAAAVRERAAASLLARLRGPRLRLFKRVLDWAQRSAPMREDALADVGLGWPVLRRMLREVGRRMVACGAIAEPDDVFWLQGEELQAAARLLDAGQPLPDNQLAIAERRAAQQAKHGATPPSMLPVKGGSRILGFEFGSMMPARVDQAAGSTFKGIGASPGRVTGPACVLHGPEEFERMKPGDILVASITTPAWTPLFAMASGIVTNVGGPLSHSSIVAREYGVPAVLGTGVATQRIHSGQHITVDGDAGIVTLCD
jgi:pyruvate,water dikinase